MTLVVSSENSWFCNDIPKKQVSTYMNKLYLINKILNYLHFGTFLLHKTDG